MKEFLLHGRVCYWGHGQHCQEHNRCKVPNIQYLQQEVPRFTYEIVLMNSTGNYCVHVMNDFESNLNKIKKFKYGVHIRKTIDIGWKKTI